MNPNLNNNTKFSGDRYGFGKPTPTPSNTDAGKPLPPLGKSNTSKSQYNPYMSYQTAVPLEGTEEEQLNSHNIYGKNTANADMLNKESNISVESADSAKVRAIIISIAVIAFILIISLLVVIFS